MSQGTSVHHLCRFTLLQSGVQWGFQGKTIRPSFDSGQADKFRKIMPQKKQSVRLFPCFPFFGYTCLGIHI
jgi:hypothetical protein